MTYIHVKITPEAKKEAIEKISEDHFTIAVRERAERNMANRRAVELVSRFFKLPIRAVKIVLGHHSRSKIVSVEDSGN